MLLSEYKAQYWEMRQNRKVIMIQLVFIFYLLSIVSLNTIIIIIAIIFCLFSNFIAAQRPQSPILDDEDLNIEPINNAALGTINSETSVTRSSAKRDRNGDDSETDDDFNFTRSKRRRILSFSSDSERDQIAYESELNAEIDSNHSTQDCSCSAQRLQGPIMDNEDLNIEPIDNAAQRIQSPTIEYESNLGRQIDSVSFHLLSVVLILNKY